jgi:LytS/YehU family sensor histidine kinase
VALLLVGIFAFTAPLTLGVLAFWSRVGVELDVEQMRTVTLVNVICVVFVAHVYETVLLIKDRAHDLVEKERAERARAEAELLALRRQVDPHFLFNCLNTLQHLIEDGDRARAVAFNQDLAAMLRYLLHTSERRVVSVDDELAFVQRYAALLRIRFGDAVSVDVKRDGSGGLPPTALQLLVENVVKHNALSASAPLVIGIDVQRDRVVVSNDRRPREGAQRGALGGGPGVGLRNLEERVRLLCGRGLDVVDDGARFSVTVPLAGDPT